MAVIPVYCKSCGTLFASRAFKISGNVRNLHLSGNRETCPVCLSMADIVDGTFDATDGVLSMISGPTLTKEILERFTTLVGRAAQKEISLDVLKKEATDLDPALGEAVAQIVAKSPSALVILLLVTLMLKSCHVSVDAKIDLNQLWDQWTANQQGIVYTPPSNAQAQNTRAQKMPATPSPPAIAPAKKRPSPLTTRRYVLCSSFRRAFVFAHLWDIHRRPRTPRAPRPRPHRRNPPRAATLQFVDRLNGVHRF